MSNSRGPPEDIETKEAFVEELTNIIRSAETGGLDIRGGWDIEGASLSHGYSIEIYQLPSSEQ